MRFEFRKSYGVGTEKASYLGDLLGLGKSILIKHINRFFEECFAILIKGNYVLGTRLNIFLRQHFFKMVHIKVKKALRLTRGLSARGQNTHSNCKQNKYYLANRWQVQTKEDLSFNLKKSRKRKSS